jgi:DNA-binding MarR family transcriptional regulator
MDMSMEAPSMDALTTIPDGIESPRAKLVYVYCSVTDGATTEQLCDNLSITRLTLYPIIESLEKRDLIERDDDQYVAA